MEIHFYNCPQPQQMDKSLLPEQPEFVSYQPDFAAIDEYEKQFRQYKNMLVIGHGGSITSLQAYYYALGYESSKKMFFLSTIDPDYIADLKAQLKKDETLVVAISKSGETTTQIEALMQFVGYPMLMITGKNSSLRAMGEKLGAVIALHPPIGGRFTGLTEVALLPAGISGLSVRQIYEGAKAVYHTYAADNPAWKAAFVLNLLEEDGYVDVFMPFYSHSLFAASNLVVQLCHESFGKGGRGQTYFAHEAPESQHHTNQRFFGGQKNICAFVTTVRGFRSSMAGDFPSPVHSVQIKGRHLADINKISLGKSMEFEAEGVMEDARIQGIPLIHASLSGVTPQETGAYVAFWQLYAIYASVLRGVNPFDQPQVENSKNISFNKRLAYKGLL